MKRIVSYVLVLSMVFTLSISASAIYDMPDDNVNYQDIIMQSGEIVTRGTKIPTKAWDWKDGVYDVGFTNVAYGIYSNYYFTGARSLRLQIKDITASETTVLVYGIYNMSNPDKGYSRGPYHENIYKDNNKDILLDFSGTDPDDCYYIFIRTGKDYTYASGRLTLSCSL